MLLIPFGVPPFELVKKLINFFQIMLAIVYRYAIMKSVKERATRVADKVVNMLYSKKDLVGRGYQVLMRDINELEAGNVFFTKNNDKGLFTFTSDGENIKPLNHYASEKPVADIELFDDGMVQVVDNLVYDDELFLMTPVLKIGLKAI